MTYLTTSHLGVPQMTVLEGALTGVPSAMTPFGPLLVPFWPVPDRKVPRWPREVSKVVPKWPRWPRRGLGDLGVTP